MLHNVRSKTQRVPKKSDHPAKVYPPDLRGRAYQSLLWNAFRMLK